MKRVTSLLPKPFGELTVGVGIGLADVMQALFTEPRQFGSLPDPEPPEPEKLARLGERNSMPPPRRRPVQRHLIICQYWASEAGHESPLRGRQNDIKRAPFYRFDKGWFVRAYMRKYHVPGTGSLTQSRVIGCDIARRGPVRGLQTELRIHAGYRSERRSDWRSISTFGTKNALPNYPARFNIAPTDAVLTVRFNPKTSERTLDALRWGLVPHWAKDLKFGTRCINARAETVQITPAFRDAFESRRCIIPASGF